ncbi:MAG TPA: dihydrofolate reductase [Xanthobacteraceae bacterium]|nr:dihydrofolate reductase [Xanthobacteraceae bacterium]
MMEIVLVAAVAENGVIGRAGDLPWRIKSDMQRFRAMTWGRPVIVGRKTYLSFARQPLPGRTNIIVSRSPHFAAPGAIVAPTLAAALEVARGDALRRASEAAMVVGGAEIYAQAMPLADRLEITHIHARPEGDTTFPAIDPAIWREAARSEHAPQAGDDAGYDAVTYVRGA